jgi:MFS family permease
VLIFRRGSPRAASSPWRALRFPAYRRWAVAHLVSTMGSWLQIVAQNLLVLTLTGSPVLAGVSVAASALPSLLLGPVGGALADRWPRRVVAATGQTLLAVVAAITGVLAATGNLSVPALIALSVASGVVGTMNGPATALLGNELVAPDDVPSAISIGSVTFNVGRVAGAAAAGIVLGAMALGVGATLGALLSGRLRQPRVATVVVLAGIGAVVQIAAAGSPTLVVLLVLALGMSLVESVAATASSTLLLTRPPEAVRGRVMGAWSTVSGLGGLVGPVLAGGLLSLFGPRTGLALGGVVFVAALVAAVAATGFGRRAAVAHVRVTAGRLHAIRLPSLRPVVASS